ncbi:MAG: 50S ribosomal protein L10 [Nanoarchaeota archaeon]
MKSKIKAHVSEGKIKAVKELSDLLKNKKTILLASIKNLPASQFQVISKKLRGKAIIKVSKKNLLMRALEESGNESLKNFKNYLQEDIAILFSDIDCFDLASELLENKSPAKAKPGQEAPEDIEVQAGPTELVPGPAISELGALGIQIKIDKGKINIKEPKVIVKEGEKISENAAGIMSKLDIKPFSIGFIPLSALNIKDNKLYLEIKIDKEKTIADLKEAFGRALPFAVEIGYLSKDTIGFMIQKAGAYANKINRIMTGEPETVAEVVEESPKEETKKEEEKAPAAAGLGALFG